ncbi:MAG: ABC transporter permease subunit [Candidatus Thorarchaeota archaeon]
MPKALSIIIEHLHEKRWIFLIFGLFMGLMGFLLTMLVDLLDIASYAVFIEMLPEEFLEILGGLEAFTSPYGFVNVELFAFVWIFVGFFVVYIASDTTLPGEVEDKTIDLILSKPISRSSFLMGKITFLYLFITVLIGVIFAFIGIGMATSQTFIDFGLHWDRLLAVYIINIVHLGTLVMTAVLFATITLSSKKTVGAALAIMFFMYFIGMLWVFFPEEQQVIKYISTWFYLGTEDLFVHGIFDNFLRDILVLIGVNVVLIIASLLIFRRQDIPV